MHVFIKNRLNSFMHVFIKNRLNNCSQISLVEFFSNNISKSIQNVFIILTLKTLSLFQLFILQRSYTSYLIGCCNCELSSISFKTSLRFCSSVSASTSLINSFPNSSGVTSNDCLFSAFLVDAARHEKKLFICVE